MDYEKNPGMVKLEELRRYQHDILVKEGVSTVFEEMSAIDPIANKGLLVLRRRKVSSISDDEIAQYPKLADDLDIFIGSIANARVIGVQLILPNQKDTVLSSRFYCCIALHLFPHSDAHEIFPAISSVTVNQMSLVYEFAESLLEKSVTFPDPLGLNDELVHSTPFVSHTNHWII